MTRRRGTHLCLLHHRGSAWFEVAEVGEDTLFEFLHIADGSPSDFKAEEQRADDIGASDVEDIVPEDTRNEIASG